MFHLFLITLPSYSPSFSLLYSTVPSIHLPCPSPLPTFHTFYHSYLLLSLLFLSHPLFPTSPIPPLLIPFLPPLFPTSPMQPLLISSLPPLFTLSGILNQDELAAEVRKARTRDRARTMELMELEAQREGRE